jgi:hypothetical protein
MMPQVQTRARQKSFMQPEIVKWMAWKMSKTKWAIGLEESMRLVGQVE